MRHDVESFQYTLNENSTSEPREAHVGIILQMNILRDSITS
jgi:hypothetical protein